MGLLPDIWNPCVSASTLRLSNPFPVNSRVSISLRPGLLVFTIYYRSFSRLISRKNEGLEHVQAGNRNSFTAFVLLMCPWLNIAPLIPCTSIQKHRNKEQVDQTTSSFKIITPLLLPVFNRFRDTGFPSDLEMLPSSMGRDSIVFVGTKVALAISAYILVSL